MQTATDAQLTRSTVVLARTAKRVGVPRDQLERFLSRGYVPQPKQLEFHAAAREADTLGKPNSLLFGGARGGGKSHTLFSQMALDDCQRRDGLKFLLLRRILISIREAVTDLRRKILFACPHEYYEQKSMIEFANGSKILLGHFQTEKDIDRYLGLEYDGIGIEELGQLNEAKRGDVLTCLRTARDDWRVRDYNTTNPGGVGHAYIKRTFIEPYRAGKENKTRFIPSTVRDNQMVNGEYVERLEGLTGWKRAAWLDGDWDIAAGQYFSTFRYDTHVVEPFDIRHAEFWCAMDYGFTHPTVVYLGAKYDGKYYIAAEHYGSKQLPSEHAAAIKAMLARFDLTLNDLRGFSAGADVFAQRGASDGNTIADQYAATGIYLTKANNDRITGAANILNLLGDAERGLESRLFIFNTCVKLIQSLPSLQHDPNRPEDVLKVDADETGENGDDYYDGARYLLAENFSQGAFL